MENNNDKSFTDSAPTVVSIDSFQKKHPTPSGLDSPPRKSAGCTELDFAQVIKTLHGREIRYVPEKAAWYIYKKESGLWVLDKDGEIDRLVINQIEMTEAYAWKLVREQDDAGNKLLSRLAKIKESRFIAGVKKVLKSLTGITISLSVFDADPLLVPVKGGSCINLKSGAVRRLQAGDFATKIIGCDYVEDASCPQWEVAILEWCCGDIQLAEFLQTLIGYLLSGLTEIQAFFFLYGLGENGKSVFINIVYSLLNDYAKNIPSESLMQRPNYGGPTNDIAMLAGARLVTSSELPEGGVFNENLLKSLTGNDTITARFLHREFFEFQSRLKLIIFGNHKPVIKGTDHGIWRRVILVPFLANIERKDPSLTEKLQKELPGILNWALAGWRKYQQEGLKIPACIKDGTQEYREEMDIVGIWLGEHTKPKIGNKISSKEFYTSFSQWTKDNGFYTPNSSAFGRMLSGRIERGRVGSARFYKDIELVTTETNLESSASPKIEREVPPSPDAGALAEFPWDD